MALAPSRQWSLVARPQGEPQPSDVRLDEVDVPDPGPGEVRVRNTWLSVDPYMRGRMDDRPSYVPPFRLEEPMTGGAVGVVELVGDGVEGVAEGDCVLHDRGWRERAVLRADAVRVVDADLAPAQAYLGVLGTTGLTAWVGVLDVAQMREGDVVLVSGAAGAVGSVAGQVARLKGASAVVGTAGGEEKVRWLLDDAGFTRAGDHRSASPADLLRDLLPDGADVYFDNVGGPTLEAALPRMRDHGRVALCGAISGYNATSAPPGPRTLGLAIGKRLRLEGFIVTDHLDRTEEFTREMAGWIARGDVVYRETATEGVESAFDAFRGVLSGANTGKMLVRLDPDL
ncbi:NADP-dependent oxidoreductase [Pseudokineococcus marinus]|uniref:NADP-dependent oxidoreductase n=1 Tax=Pseudokineococcus marinus TaxID=351215 RepID=A0A849BML1_9ACTN|nr:NADP-dependent oxidoreductase [Pseudokineococcus marinus]NNH22032.1 NADP-dependent oxidoreductase [Pseudokineococcus marinus]